jgi:hypothetical protein
MVKTLRVHLESLRYFDTVKASIAKLAAWEKKFYNVQQDALKQIPRALAELDARLGKVLAETAPKEMHTVASGVEADKAAAALPLKQRVRDTPGKVLAKVEDEAPKASAGAKTSAQPKAAAKSKPKTSSPPPLKEKPDPVKPPEEGTNTKKQAVADAVAAADRERISKLSNEVRLALERGDLDLALSKKKEAQDILSPYIPKKDTDSWDEVIKRLDVSSPKDGAVFWSGDAMAAQRFAEKHNGVTLETTAGGRIIDGWDEVNKGLPWTSESGKPGPYARDLWVGVSKKYAEGTSGIVNVVQKEEKLRDTKTVWHNAEKELINIRRLTGEVSDIKMHKIDGDGFIELSSSEIDELMKIKGTLR